MVVLEVIILDLKMMFSLIKAIFEVFVLPKLKSVENEIILITGTGHGMGREVALRLGRLGGKVICVDINKKGNQETVDLIRKESGKAYRYECDVTNREAVLELKEKVCREVGEVTMLINNAGIMPCKPFLAHSAAEIRAVFELNIIAHHWTCQAFLPSMMERNHGHIVAMSSMAGVMGLRNLVPYCATKYGVRGFMESLSEELREHPKDYSGIKFTTIFPYIVDTGLAKNPRVKFTNLMKIVSPQDAADQIVDSIRRNYFSNTIPKSMHYNVMIASALPRNVGLLAKDFVDTGLDPHPY
ncbi:epidermal retinol dehydrogenase 2-like [Hyposmocoma kahamanoa]|uniref:epidermal retinol dehydrogenase 2-like n=1 Tax=Hyposmocoma kahamanoa TaxID=1477025 RepID=UPI000E6D5E8D|nr:epidermal retinol dehydrogenase 2-like [Hyposmocoma kahamanoa]XP_026320062.1 epidermal retinol dehydrogenase 2-like [Hyposmocoma kahamanoa]